MEFFVLAKNQHDKNMRTLSGTNPETTNHKPQLKMARPRKPDYIRITVTQMHGKRVVKAPQSVTFDVTGDDDFAETFAAVQAFTSNCSAICEEQTQSEPEGGEA